jgi:copper oxidase (laccase) domain-containing protein
MDKPQWFLKSSEDYRYFELQDSGYSLKCTVRDEQDRYVDAIVPILLEQIHSSLIIDVDSDSTRVGDGLLSSLGHGVLGIKIADCLPVYLYNDSAMCLIHCGWRGILSGIARNARYLMGTYSYALGACIGPECYEVKTDVVDRFKERYAFAISEKEDMFYLDLKKAVMYDLGEESLVTSLDLCTKCHPEYFYSYRRGDRRKRNYALMARI